MKSADYIIIFLFILGIVGAGMVFAGKMKNSKDMFAAGGQSPWWVSGLSAFMTMFSAGTFVIWGGIAYRYGFVAVVINLAYGIAALLVGWLLAGCWRKAGVNSASEFLQLRYGTSIVQFYTWFKGTSVLFSTGGSVYALSVVICALIPLPDGHLLADPTTGYLSVSLTSIILCAIVIVIALVGGLWAVLITDVLQFVILTVSVVFILPLILIKVGGWGEFVTAAPEGFMSPVAADFSWWFLIGWMTVNFFVFGGDWAFVQRYVCVPGAKDAKKAAYLIGAMYLISPLFWMLPPIIFRVINPNVDSEQAYILACKLVLPAGMMGLMVAAMASATASQATTRLNVFAGAFTTEVYHRIFNKTASESQLVFVGRMITLVLGIIIIAGALLIPRYGYTSYIIDINTLLYVPLILPTVWGLFSRKIGMAAVWTTTLAGFITAYLVKFALAKEGILGDVASLQPIVEWIAANSRIADILSGIVVPFVLLTSLELIEKKQHPGWDRIEETRKLFREAPAPKALTLPGKMVAITLAIIGVAMVVLSIVNESGAAILLSFAAVLLVISGVLYFLLKRSDRRNAEAGSV